VLLLPEDGAPTVFQQGESYTLSESPDEEGTCGRTPPPVSTHRPQYRWIPVRETPSTESTAPSDGSVEIDPSGDGIEAFAAMYIREAEGSPGAKGNAVFRRTRPGLTSTILGTNASWFGRKLANVVEYENDRVRDGDDLVTVYTGVDLTPAGSQFLE